MAKWRVCNKHPQGLTHKEKFRDQVIEIPAGEYVLMDYEEAVRFRGQYFPMMKDAQGAPDPRGFKCIFLEPHEDQAKDSPAAKEYVCHLDGAKFPTQALLDKYLADNYPDQTFVDEEIEAEIERETKAKRGPGRPAKEKSA